MAAICPVRNALTIPIPWYPTHPLVPPAPEEVQAAHEGHGVLREGHGAGPGVRDMLRCVGERARQRQGVEAAEVGHREEVGLVVDRGGAAAGVRAPHDGVAALACDEIVVVLLGVAEPEGVLAAEAQGGYPARLPGGKHLPVWCY